MSQSIAERVQSVSEIPECAAWCVEHCDGNGHPDDAYCTSATVETGSYRAFIANGHVPGQGRLQRVHVERTMSNPYKYVTPGLSVLEAAELGRALQQLAREAMAKA